MTRRSFFTLLCLLLVLSAGSCARSMPVYTPPPCEPTVDRVLFDLETAVNGMPIPCWAQRSESARRVGRLLRAALEAK